MSDPLSVEEMWQIVLNNRGFQSSSSGKGGDPLRQQPATIPATAAANDKGHPVGKGYETFACLQVVDAEGRSMGVGADFFDHGGLDDHAEARAIRGMEKAMPGSSAGGRLIVVVDQDVCPSCEAKLKAFAEQLQLKDIDIHIPERVNFSNPAKMASPKTTARTALMNPDKPTGFRLTKLRSISIRQVSGPRSETSVTASMAGLASGLKLGLAVTGAAATGLGMAATVTGDFRYREASELLQPRVLMKWAMLQSLKDLPKPTLDPRAAADFFSDRNTASGLRTIDLLNQHLKPFGHELAQHHAKVRAGTMLEVVRASIISRGKSVELLDSLGAQLELYFSELSTILDNLDAAQELAPKAMEAAKNAQQLAETAEESGLALDFLFRQNFDVAEISQMLTNLKTFASITRQAFQDLATLRQQVQQMLLDLADDAQKVNKLYWAAILQPLVEAMNRAGAQAAPSGIGADADRVLRVLAGATRLAKGRIGLSAEEIYQQVRKDGRGFIPGLQTVQNALLLLQSQGFISSSSGPGNRGGAEYFTSVQGEQYLAKHAAPALSN